MNRPWHGPSRGNFSHRRPGDRRAAVVMVAFALAAPLAGCGQWADDLFCDGPDPGCEFSRSEWFRISELAGIGRPTEVDKTNRYIGQPAAIELGRALYHTRLFSGPARGQDTLGRPSPSTRPPVGGRIEVSCADCHDPLRAGSDFTSRPRHVSEGAGWYDVNIQQTLNASHYKLLYWNGRSDSLWAQAAGVMESPVSMNGNRMEIVRTVVDNFRAEYEAVFPTFPLPPLPPRAELEALLEGPVCKGSPPEGACPAGCRRSGPTDTRCWPEYPLRGKAGAVLGCQPGSPTEPEGDAFDCMEDAKRTEINRTYANIAKAIGAYEWELASHNSPFDQFVAGKRDALSPEAVRGLKLFVGRASCVDCHRTPLFSDSEFHNIGVPQTGTAVPTEAECTGQAPTARCNCRLPVATAPPNTDPAPMPPAGTAVPPWAADTCLPWGYYAGLTRLRGATFRGDGEFSDDTAHAKQVHGDYYKLADGAQVDATKATWRTPSLRDVALTPPYMHDGLYQTLEEVIWHYDVGGTAETSGKKAVELRPLFLSAQDRYDLAEFLRSLTGSPISPALHQPPTPALGAR